VIRSGGVLGNYGGGPEMKEFLLRLEGAIGD
jgi:O6-methylguanine-DNA--protein-cysteine methyltransferase